MTRAEPTVARLIVLGSGTCAPSGRRASPGYWLEAPGCILRLDCGPGTVHAMERFGLPWAEVTHQFLSHFHVDHIGDLPALLFALKWARTRPRSHPLVLIGPHGLRDRLDGMVKAFGPDLVEQEFPLVVEEVAPGDRVPLIGGVSLEIDKAAHTPEALVVKVALGAVTVGYTGDTGDREGLAQFFSGADVLVAECSFVSGDPGAIHLDAERVARLAHEAGVRLLVVSHFYQDPVRGRLARILTERFGGPVIVAEDGTRIALDPAAPSSDGEPAGDGTAILHRVPGALYLEVAGGSGVRLIDREGREYLDASSGVAVSCLGHDEPVVRESVVRRLRSVPYAHTSFFSSSDAEALAAHLVRKSPPDMDRVVFSSSGSEAVEVALKLAKQYFTARGEPQRNVFIGRRHSYHGATLATLSVGSSSWRKRPFTGLLTDHVHIAPCYPYRCQWPEESPEAYGLRAAHELQEAIDRVGSERVIAFVAETVAGATLGAVPPAPGYFDAIREICSTNDILFILDEVMCGLYRTGYFNAFAPEGVTPDIFCFAKGLAAGYQPLAATVVRRKVHKGISEMHGGFRHTGTFLGHPTACSAGLATQRLIEERELDVTIRSRGALLKELLEDRCAHLEIVGDIRGRGLFYGLELVRDRLTREPLSDGAFALDVKRRAMAEGVLIYPGGGGGPEGSSDHVLVAPPFVVSESELEEMVDRIVRAIDRTRTEWPE